MAARSHSNFNPLRILGWAIAAAVLLAPAIAMQFSDEVSWGAGDFVVMASLLALVGGAIEGISRSVQAAGLTKWVMAGGVVFVGLAIWAELAVGIFY